MGVKKGGAMKEVTDEQIIMKHSKSVRPRARMELKIVNQIIASASEAGYTIRVYIDRNALEEYQQPGSYDVRSAIFDLDDATLTFHGPDGERTGWVYLVMGNDGYDVVSDYSTNLETFLRPATALAERLENGLE